MTEYELIYLCRKQIEEKLQLPDNGSWKQRDFQYLSDLIFERTDTRLSISTLKRIWKNGDNHLPQLFTLNALVRLLDYESWNDYKKEQGASISSDPVKKTIPQPEREKNRSVVWVLALLLPIVIVGAFLFFWPVSKSINPNDIVFRSRKNIEAGVPNTVVFEYDISKAHFDSAFIQQSWDTRLRARVTKENNFQTFIYYYPGYHTAKLILDDKIVKEERVTISTRGWAAMINGDLHNEAPYYIDPKDISSDNRLFVSPQTLRKNDIPIDSRDFFVHFFNVGTFPPFGSDQFSFETTLKNDLKEGGLVCQYTQLNLICENGMISIPFCNPGCASNIHLHIGDIVQDGKKNDLAALGIDLSEWNTIRISSSQKKLTVFVNNNPVYTVRYNRDLGVITGFHYRFSGCGSVKDIRAWNEKKELVYKEDFSLAGKQGN